MTFSTSIYIDSDEIENLDSKTECLRSVLSNSYIEVTVDIDFDYNPGSAGGLEEPPYSAEADLVGVDVIDVEFNSDSREIEDNIKFLITKEQREAIKSLAVDIIERDWGTTYEEMALESMPDPDDYYDD